jgi:uncharacterized membrane protein YgcG
MDRFDTTGSPDPAKAAESFARYLHDSWGVGDAACDNGLLLLLSVGNRQSFVSTGAGVVEALPDDVISVILDNMKPELRERR